MRHNIVRSNSPKMSKVLSIQRFLQIFHSETVSVALSEKLINLKVADFGLKTVIVFSIYGVICVFLFLNYGEHVVFFLFCTTGTLSLEREIAHKKGNFFVCYRNKSPISLDNFVRRKK